MTPEGVQSIIKVLNDHLTKKELGSVTLERVIAMEKDLGSYRAMIGPLIQIIYDMVAKTGDEHIVVKGLSNLLSHSEFIGEDADRSLFLELEDEEKLALRFREAFPDRIRIHIASEGNGLDRASFVTCPFRLRGNLEGAVCIIGPKRMNYGKAVARLEYLANQIHAASGFESPFPLIETKET